MFLIAQLLWKIVFICYLGQTSTIEHIFTTEPFGKKASSVYNNELVKVLKERTQHHQ